MSFIQHNENFLKFELYIPLRGLTGADRALKYQNSIRPEARRRIQAYFETVKNDISRRIAFYVELLEELGELEQRYLLYSIYFDPNSDQLITELGPIVLRHLDLTGEPLKRLFEQQIAPHDRSITKGFLKQYFTETIDLSSGEWEEEDGTRNPVTKKLAIWMVKAISANETTEGQLEGVVLNYTKLWNIYFTHPFDSNKAIILIHKLLEQYKPLDPQHIKFDVHRSFLRIHRFLNELLPLPADSPLTDIEADVQPNFRAYQNKRTELQNRLKSDAVFFQDLSSRRWPDILAETCIIALPGRKAYLAEIIKRRDAGRTPNFTEVSEFLKKIKTEDVQQEFDQKMADQIIAENYLFFT